MPAFCTRPTLGCATCRGPACSRGEEEATAVRAAARDEKRTPGPLVQPEEAFVQREGGLSLLPDSHRSSRSPVWDLAATVD
jgi:hypothetical protein